MNMLDADAPSPYPGEYAADLDIDLGLDLNINLMAVNAAAVFDCPMWTENDALSRELTDSILSENFAGVADRETHPANDQLLADVSDAAVTSDLIWNAFTGVDQLYYEDMTDATTSPTSGNSNASDMFIYQVEPLMDANFISSSHEQKADVHIESLTDACDFDVLRDGLFELDLFSECLKDVDETAVVPTTSFDVAVSDCGGAVSLEGASTVAATPVVDWNRRRSLLYDKNEFARSPTEKRVSCRRHPIAKQPPVAATGPRSADQRTYRCSVRDCEKTYCKASHLKSHMRRHSGVKPFACDWTGCSWRFSRSDELARHKRSHSGVKPYTCNLCEKAFSRSDHLSKHAKVHMKKMALYGTPIITKKCNYKYLSVSRIPVE